MTTVESLYLALRRNSRDTGIMAVLSDAILEESGENAEEKAGMLREGSLIPVAPLDVKIAHLANEAGLQWSLDARVSVPLVKRLGGSVFALGVSDFAALWGIVVENRKFMRDRLVDRRVYTYASVEGYKADARAKSALLAKLDEIDLVAKRCRGGHPA